jgi:hypothetical protein
VMMRRFRLRWGRSARPLRGGPPRRSGSGGSARTRRRRPRWLRLPRLRLRRLRLPRLRLPRWHWPAPFGGPATITLIALVLLAVPVAVAIRWTSATVSASVSAPPASVATSTPGPTEPAPLFSEPAIPDPTPTPEPTMSYGGSASPDPHHSPSSAAPAQPATTGAFAAIAGPGCRETTAAGSYAAYPAGWPVSTVAGGFTGNGCTGRFWAVPMSGSAKMDDSDTHVLWWFSTAPVMRGKCDIWVFVPKAKRALDVAGDPTVYQVLRGRDDDRVIDTFSIRQQQKQGTWVKGGTFANDGGQIAVRLRNRGAGTGDARHAAAQIVTNCKPA